MRVPGADNEYYVFENRQLEGFDRSLPNHGMLVWHIDQDMEIWQNNRVNTDPGHQRVDVVEADGKAAIATRAGERVPGSNAISLCDSVPWSGDRR